MNKYGTIAAVFVGMVFGSLFTLLLISIGVLHISAPNTDVLTHEMQEDLKEILAGNFWSAYQLGYSDGVTGQGFAALNQTALCHMCKTFTTFSNGTHCEAPREDSPGK